LGGVDFGRLFLLRQSVIGAAHAAALAEDAPAAARAFDTNAAKQVLVEQFTKSGRAYRRVTVSAEAQGLFGFAGKRVEASVVVREPK